MAPRLLLLILGSLIIAILLSGCAEHAAPQATETPAATPTLPPTTTLVAETPSAPPEPFPGALSLGTPYRYGREDIAMEVTVSKVKLMPEYEWWSPKWGGYWNTSPKKGNQFLFVFVRLVDRGTIRARMPSQSMFVLHGDGNSYVETSDRDNSLRIKGIDVKQFDFYFDTTDGWIEPTERVEGFLLYEVPASITPEHAYLEVTFSSKAAAVWKLG